MAPNKDPIFVLKPVYGHAAIATANAYRDGRGAMATLLTGTTDGTRITQVICKATGTCTGGMLRFYVKDPLGVVTLISEVPVVAKTPSANAPTWGNVQVLSGDNAWILPNGCSLMVSTHKAENFRVSVFGGAYS